MPSSTQPERSEATKVKVDGEEASLHITDQSVMFEKGGRVSGFERSAIRMVKPDGDAMIIAYSVGSEVRSVRVEPLTAVTSLVASSTSLPPAQISTTGLDAVFEKLYRDARKELEEKLDQIKIEPENRNLRLTETSEEFQRFVSVRNKMWDIIAAKYHFDPYAPGNSIGFFGLENQPHDRQLDSVKSLHLNFLLYLTRDRAESNDAIYETTDVWPEEWDIVLLRFGLSDGGPLPTERWKNYLTYLRPKWTRYQKGSKTPPLARQ